MTLPPPFWIRYWRVGELELIEGRKIFLWVRLFVWSRVCNILWTVLMMLLYCDYLFFLVVNCSAARLEFALRFFWTIAHIFISQVWYSHSVCNFPHVDNGWWVLFLVLSVAEDSQRYSEKANYYGNCHRDNDHNKCRLGNLAFLLYSLIKVRFFLLILILIVALFLGRAWLCSEQAHYILLWKWSIENQNIVYESLKIALLIG